MQFRCSSVWNKDVIFTNQIYKLREVVPVPRDCNSRFDYFILQISKRDSPATFSCSSSVSGIWSSSPGTQVICFQLQISGHLRFVHLTSQPWHKGQCLSWVKKKSMLSSSFPAISLQHLGEFNLQHTWVNEPEQSDGWDGWVCFSVTAFLTQLLLTVSKPEIQNSWSHNTQHMHIPQISSWKILTVIKHEQN